MTLIPRLLLALVLLIAPASAAEPFLKPNDVIALVGGEDVVTLTDSGYLELLLVRAQPSLNLRFRSLAWEGDTVFEQRRDLNYPTLEQQLDQIGATVVIAQFGKMERLAGADKLSEFIAAYQKQIEHLQAGGKRRVALLTSTPEPADESTKAWTSAIRDLAGKNQLLFLHATVKTEKPGSTSHLSADTQRSIAWEVGKTLDVKAGEFDQLLGAGLDHSSNDDLRALLKLIQAKNRLWFNYYRPQNWAFLAGDRTNQPSSRDHLDRNIRWFPAEMEQYLPLIAAKEKEINALATQLAKPTPKP